MARLKLNGAALFYEEAGSGAPPLLLVHDWAADHTYVGGLFEQLRCRHRAVTVDLRGHGLSDRPRPPYTIAGFAEDLVGLCRELHLGQPVVVGQGMGGVIALDVGVGFPDIPRAIVAIDVPSRLWSGPRRSAPPLPEILRTPSRQRALAYFGHRQDARPSVSASVVGPIDVLLSTWESVWSYDLRAALAACTTPILHLAAWQPVPELAPFQRLCPYLFAAQMNDVGCFDQTHRLERVDAKIESFLNALFTQRSPQDQRPSETCADG